MERPLRDSDVLLVDCQSTGASPEQGSLLELGWSVARASRIEGAAFVWRHLIEELEEHEVRTWDQLHLWLVDTAPMTARGRKVFPIARETRLSVPDQPGIYRLLRRNGDVLYVGKAISLRRRVNSYFTKQRGIHERHLEMLSQVRDLSVTVTATALEAALLECDEIKSLEPPYNKQLRETERAAWFATADFEHARSESDLHHRVGPLPSQMSLAALAALAAEVGAASGAVSNDKQSASTGGAAGDSGRRAARALGVPASFAPDDAPFGDGVALFVSQRLDEGNAVGVRKAPRRRLMALSKALWQQQIDGQLDLDGDGDEQERTWDPERIARHLTRVVLQAGQLVRRARWLCLLSEATVVYSEPGSADRRRLLVVQRTAVTSHEDLQPGEPQPIPAEACRSPSERRRSFDVAGYDRLRVLSTELKRISGQGGAAAVCLGEGRLLSGALLERMLSWI